MNLVDKELVEGCECKSVIYDNINTIERDIIPDMIKAMGNGVGLAAPQVGINKRFFIMKYQGEIISVYNPIITFKSKQKKALKEGCLTYPQNIYGTVNIMRPTTVQARFINKEGNEECIRFRGFEAKIFQHELDHLNGLTIFYRGEK